MLEKSKGYNALFDIVELSKLESVSFPSVQAEKQYKISFNKSTVLIKSDIMSS
jgi:hypothetical protein